MQEIKKDDVDEVSGGVVRLPSLDDIPGLPLPGPGFPNPCPSPLPGTDVGAL
ncbi:MAG: hypothetical protein ACK50B_06380 [Betaproteobacteria bacterium]|jgi:hypothetical protein